VWKKCPDNRLRVSPGVNIPERIRTNLTSTPKTPISDTPGAECGARDALGLPRIIKNHPELTKLIEAWPDVSLDLRAAILKMISK
jgi:hypothetical protein